MGEPAAASTTGSRAAHPRAGRRHARRGRGGPPRTVGTRRLRGAVGPWQVESGGPRRERASSDRQDLHRPRLRRRRRRSHRPRRPPRPRRACRRPAGDGGSASGRRCRPRARPCPVRRVRDWQVRDRGADPVRSSASCAARIQGRVLARVRGEVRARSPQRTALRRHRHRARRCRGSGPGPARAARPRFAASLCSLSAPAGRL